MQVIFNKNFNAQASSKSTQGNVGQQSEIVGFEEYTLKKGLVFID